MKEQLHTFVIASVWSGGYGLYNAKDLLLRWASWGNSMNILSEITYSPFSSISTCLSIKKSSKHAHKIILSFWTILSFWPSDVKQQKAIDADLRILMQNKFQMFDILLFLGTKVDQIQNVNVKNMAVKMFFPSTNTRS